MDQDTTLAKLRSAVRAWEQAEAQGLHDEAQAAIADAVHAANELWAAGWRPGDLSRLHERADQPADTAPSERKSIVEITVTFDVEPYDDRETVTPTAARAWLAGEIAYAAGLPVAGLTEADTEARDRSTTVLRLVAVTLVDPAEAEPADSESATS